MNQPEYILTPGARLRTLSPMPRQGGGFLIKEHHLVVRKADAIGAVCGIVGGHGGDVYWVAHIGDPCMAAYGFWEFELEPAKEPCTTCEGSGIDWPTSKETKHCTACRACKGTAEQPPPRPAPISVYEHLRRDVLGKELKGK